MKRVVAVGAAVAMLVVASFMYVRAGWTRMEDDCGADPPGLQSGQTVRCSWSWSPLGFQCTFDDGHQRTSLWF